MTGDDLAPAVAFVRARLGLDGAAYHPAYLRRRIHARVAARRAKDVAAYLEVAASDPEELAALEQSLTVNLTRFFRDRSTWDALASKVAPALAGRRARVWSAGCASGEEAWSLAMALDADVLGTDVDPDALARARRGVYASAADVPADLAARFLEPAPEGVRVGDALRARVRFLRHDLLAPPPGRFDLVVCRNVVIYLTREARDRALGRLVDALLPGGHLVMGRTEILFPRHLAHLDVVDARERIYRRRDAPRAEAAP